LAARSARTARPRAQSSWTKNIAGFKRLAKFAPFVAGDTFTQADCAAFANLPLVGMATKAIYGEDMLLAAGWTTSPTSSSIGERPTAQKVVADRKAHHESLTP
jgi:glutathione S-transferase